MEYKEGEIVVTIPDGKQPKHTELFVAMMTRILNKGIDNPAFQINAISLLATGKPFAQLLDKNSNENEQFMQALKSLAETLIGSITSNSSPNMSESTLDDFLDKN